MKQGFSNATRGVTEVELLEEPVAALMWLMRNETPHNLRSVMVIDFGGGTCDVAVIGVSGNTIQLIGAAGEERLGGELIDDLLVERFAAELPDPDWLKRPENLSSLQRQMEHFKIKLNDELIVDPVNGSYHVPIRLGGNLRNVPFEMSASQFEECLRRPRRELDRDGSNHSVIEAFRSLIQRMSDYAPHHNLHNIDRVYLVGGSSRLYFVRRVAAEIFQHAPDSEFFPTEDQIDRVVAYGAALHQFRRVRGQRTFTSVLPSDISLHVGGKELLLLRRGQALAEGGVVGKFTKVVRTTTVLEPPSSLKLLMKVDNQTVKARDRTVFKHIYHDCTIEPDNPRHQIDPRVTVTIDGIVKCHVELHTLGKKLEPKETYPVYPDEGIDDYKRNAARIVPSLSGEQNKRRNTA